VPRDLPKRAPEPYDQIPPVKGRVTGAAARERGRIWWRLYNLAAETGLPDAEVTRFKEIADDWYALSRKKA